MSRQPSSGQLLGPDLRPLYEQCAARNLSVPTPLLEAPLQAGDQEDDTGLWRKDLYDGYGTLISRPPSFDKFITSDRFLGFSTPPHNTGKKGLTERQESFLRRGVNFRPEELFDPAKTVTQMIACFGKGCLAFDEKLTCQRSKMTKMMAEWEEDGRALHLPSLNLCTGQVEVMPASPVYQKGEDVLYRVEMADGRSFRATGHHECLVRRETAQQPARTRLRGGKPMPRQEPSHAWSTVDQLEPGQSYLLALDNTHPLVWARVEDVAMEGVGPFYDLHVPGTNCYFDAQGLLHANSGKDLISSWLMAWIAFVILSMRDPWHYLGMAHGDALDIANIAVNAAQARTVFFEKLKARLRRPCFQQFVQGFQHDPLRGLLGTDIAKFYRQVPGHSEPLLLLQIHSLHAQNPQGWEGKSLIAWLMDEADAFETTSGQANADQCYSILTSSAATRFGSRYIGIVISYRRVQDGFLDSLHADALKYPDSMVWDEATTFEVLPWRTKSEPEIARHYERDPIDAASKYENIAPATVDAFITYPARLESCIEHARHPAGRVSEYATRYRNPHTGVDQAYIALKLEGVQSDRDRIYFIHGDPGITDCSFGLCLCHLEMGRAVARGHDLDPQDGYDGDLLLDEVGHPLIGRRVVYYDGAGKEVDWTTTDAEGRHHLWLKPGRYTYVYWDGQGQIKPPTPLTLTQSGLEMEIEQGDVDDAGAPKIERRVVFPIVEDLILEWRPRDGMPVDFNNVETVIKGLCKLFNVYQVTFDKYNSATTVQSLQAAGINAQDMSFSNPQQMAMYKNLRQMIYMGLVRLLGRRGDDLHAAERANYQVRRVRNRNNLRVEPGQGPNGEKDKKDLADARAAAVYWACQLAGAVHQANQGLNLLTGAQIMGRGPTGQGALPAAIGQSALGRARLLAAQGQSEIFTPPTPEQIVEAQGHSPVAAGVPYQEL